MNLKYALKIAVLAFPFAATPALAMVGGGDQATLTFSEQAAQTRMAVRDLWVEHVFWVRSYVMATFENDNARAAASEVEVIANAKALAQSIAPFYGDAASARLLELLAGHWDGIKRYALATKTHQDGAADGAIDLMTANAHDIAAFLSAANPYLPEGAVFGLLATHISHHVTEIEDVSDGDFKAEAKTWGVMRKHMLVIGDAITDALIKQFPGKF